ncbi:MAG: glycosyltransferase family 4 protein [Acidimicrobiia bacterium]
MTRRLVHVTTTDMSLELLLGPQLSAFVDAGYEVYGASAPGRYVEAITARGVTHIPLEHATRSMAPHRDAGALIELVQVFRRLRPDIVHTHNPKPGIYGRLAARAAGVPVIVNTVHGLYAMPDDPATKRAVVYGLERIAAAASHAELVQNPEDIPILRRLRITAAKLCVLGNGVDLERFRPGRLTDTERNALRAEWGVGPDDIVVGAVGRLVWEKGYRELFAAARAVTGHDARVHFVVVGGLDEAKADQLGPADLRAIEADARITFLGLRDDVADLYAAMDLYVLASYREGFPRSAMEAAATGLPIVATDIRGCRQVVDPGVTGLLVPVRDADALATAISSLTDDDATRARMAAAALEKARSEFDDRRIVATTLATYDRLLARARVGR